MSENYLFKNVNFFSFLQVTFAILLISVILVSTYSYIDSSNSAIQCYFEAKGTNIPQVNIFFRSGNVCLLDQRPKGAKHCQICKSLYSQVVINRYCWIMSTFTLPKHYTGTAGDEFLHFGVGKFEFLQF